MTGASVQSSPVDLYSRYWAHFGSPPQSEEVEHLYLALLEEGVDLDLLERCMRRSPGAARRRAMAEACLVNVSGGQEITYVVHPAEGSKVLLVGFTGITLGAEPPYIGLLVGDQSTTHRMGVSIGADQTQDARGLRAWGRAAAETITQVAGSLGVPMSNVICYGAGLQGSRALVAGLSARAGWVLAGGPIIRMGSWISEAARTAPENAPVRALYARHLELSGLDKHQSGREDLDRLIGDLALEAAGSRVHVVVSPDDIFHDESLELRRVLRTVGVGASYDVIEGEYGEHGGVEMPLHRHVDRMVAHVQRRA